MRANLILKSFACLAVAGVIAGCGGQKKKEEAAKAEQDFRKSRYSIS